MTDRPDLRFTCPKCGHRVYEVGEIRVAGGMLSSVFDVENRKFSTVTCERCRHTDLFQAESGKLASLFDLFTT